MQATLDAYAIKPFTRALTCLSKYGDDLTIRGTPETLSLSTTNSSMSAYCRFKYDKRFFAKYRVGNGSSLELVGDVEEPLTVTGQLLTKSLLSVLKHRTVEKSVDRCELSIVEGNQTAGNASPDENKDSFESKLIVRLHCKHGVIKTHRLLLLVPTSLMAPGVPDTDNESRLTIGPRALKDMVEHFPMARGTKSDPQLLWSFGETEVEVKSIESSIDSRGKAQISTELTISSDEFDVYNVHAPPTMIAFHLREFIATITFAESMALCLDLRFTDPASPLFIDIDGDSLGALFVVSTSQVPGSSRTSTAPIHPASQASNKREREKDSAEPVWAKKPAKVVHREEPSPRISTSRFPESMTHPPARSTPREVDPANHLGPPTPVEPPAKAREPLFLPSSSQLSTADVEALKVTGLGIENMDRAEFEEMMEGEGEEMDLDSPLHQPEAEYPVHGQHPDEPMMNASDSFELVDDMELAPTQSSRNREPFKDFRPLFDD